jgi:hypothetical protein
MKSLSLFTFFAISIYSCSLKIGSTITSKQPPLSDTDFVLVLQQQDDFTNDGIEVGTIKSKDKVGLSTFCTYSEVINKLKQLARQNGANVIKIIAHKEPNRWSECERITAKIYRVPDYRNHEKEIDWMANRKLTWEDFKRALKLVSESNTAAQTFCSFSFQSKFLSFHPESKIVVKNSFSCDLSWVRSDQKERAGLLEHEQGHFDLCEVYARQLRKKIEENKLTVRHLKIDADILLKDVYAWYLDRKELYEKETNYGLNRQKQVEWTAAISNELSNLSRYAK